MSRDVPALADAILHEGFLLYPYSESALKNVHRYPFGTLYPEEFCRVHEAGDPSRARVECVVLGPAEARISVHARFLHIVEPHPVVRDAHVPARTLADLAVEHRASFSFPALAAEITVHVVEVRDGLSRVAVQLDNTTPPGAANIATRDEALGHALASAHLLLGVEGGAFASAIDPPEPARALVERCRSRGLWPVLVGEPGTHDTLLAAPIILYDYPELAPESPGDFFDGTEMDELLTLRVLTLTDEEKRAMAAGDPRARALLERTEAAGLAKTRALHGRTRSTPALQPGTAVVLRPKGRADIFDLALAGKHATIASVERDLEGGTYFAVTIDDDPGKDLGAYGHRFFFRPEEVEPR